MSQRVHADRRRLVFLPGVSGDARFWEPVAAALPTAWEKRFVDWPGVAGAPASAAVGSYDDLAALVLAELGDRAVVVAQSMGGIVAVDVALREPSRVSGLVLCATSAGLDPAQFDAADWRPAHRQANPNAPSWIYAPTEDMSARLSELTLPVLVISPTHDPISPLAMAEYLAQLLPKASLVSIESDDHWVARSQPEAVAEAIAAHLASLPSDA
jgi:pimeloyl-ACP methyl ester carboxylesterase